MRKFACTVLLQEREKPVYTGTQIRHRRQTDRQTHTHAHTHTLWYKGITMYHIAQNFDRGNFDAFQLDRQNLTHQIV